MDENNNKQIPEQNVPKPLEKNRKKMSRKERRETDFPNDPVKGRAFHGWAKFFFVLTCIGVIFAGAMIALPIFMVLFGAISVIVWLAVVAFASLITVFMIWTSEDAKSFFGGWADFNSKLLTSSQKVLDFAQKAIPYVLISGGIIIFITWVFQIVGISTDKVRKKKYVGKIIALSIFTVCYIVFLAVILINNSSVAQTTSSSSI